MLRRIATGALAIAIAAGAAGTAAAPASSAADAAKPSYIYGIDDNNVIWEVDPIAKTIVQVNDTNLLGNQVSNSMAYDTDRDQFLFMYSGTSAKYQNKLLFWDRLTTGINSLDDVASLGNTGLNVGSANTPANASYWNNAFWFFRGNSAATLTRVDMTYVGGKPQAGTPTSYNVPALPTGSYNFGDIAITKSGMLFGTTSNGAFFKIDLTKVATDPAGAFTFIRSGLPSLQLSFSYDYTTLFGHRYDNGDWFTLDTTTGGLTNLNFSTPLGTSGTGFRDLGGASTTQAGTECVVAPPGNTQDQTAHVGTAVPLPLKVYVGTTDGFPQENVEVIFRIASGGGNMAGAQEVVATTNANGVATAPDWILGPTPGTNTVQVDNTGTVCDFTFNATAILGPTPPPNPEPDPTPGPGPDPTPQEPVKPIVLPSTVRNEGVTTLVKLPIETNAGQYVRAKANCTPLVRSRPAGDTQVACRVFKENQRIKVWVSGKIAVGVTLKLHAPATGDFSSYKKLKQYVTKAIR